MRLFRAMTAYFEAEALNRRVATAREVAYDAIAYAQEQTAKLQKYNKATPSPQQKLGFAIAFMQNCLPGMTDDEATMYIESLLAKIPHVGATHSNKI